MYKVTSIQTNGHVNSEEFYSIDRALNRFDELKAKKEKFNLNVDIYLEEFQVHQID